MHLLRHAHEVSAFMDTHPTPALADLIQRRLVELVTDDINMEDLLFFVIPESTDDLAAIDTALSSSTRAPDGQGLWEVIEDHGSCFELVFVLSSTGFGALVFADKCQCHPEVLALCQAHAIPAQEWQAP